MPPQLLAHLETTVIHIRATLFPKQAGGKPIDIHCVAGLRWSVQHTSAEVVVGVVGVGVVRVSNTGSSSFPSEAAITRRGAARAATRTEGLPTDTPAMEALWDGETYPPHMHHGILTRALEQEN